ncbi:hypothetical protein BKA62DRAFT_444389 [Auriculariales sp. MPI-PUGE-AT-0066]|nr:hypothetical protein BKA62DRAFT_444389 [Auriculariales sp. MPI-PUGE-AT-0066]
MTLGDFIHCPESNPVSYGRWFQLNQSPRINACSVCYQKHIASTALAGAFKERQCEHGEEITCSFFVPRILAIWRECVQNGTTESLAGYAIYRAAVKNCVGLVLVEPTSIPAVYHLARGEIRNFSICSACFEDYFISNGMFHHFVRSPPGHGALFAPGEKFRCDAATPMIRSAARTYADRDWNAFVGWVSGRCTTPSCLGHNVTVNDNRRAWTMTGVSNLDVCEACYMDNIAFAPPAIRNAWIPAAAQPGRWYCDFSNKVLHAGFRSSVQYQSVDTFKLAVSVLQQVPPCNDDGVANGSWFVLKGDETSDAAFKMCSSCYFCLVVTSNSTEYFTQRQFADGAPHLCDLRVTEKNTQLKEILAHISRAVGTKDIDHFRSFANELATTPTCPRDNWVSGPRRRWYGTANWTACSACYREVIRDSTLARILPLQGQMLPVGMSGWCELYSPRMRRLFAQACVTQNLSSLEAAAEERRQANKLVLEQVQAQAAHEQLRISIYRNAISLQAADAAIGAIADSDYKYGSGELGWHHTSSGAESVALYREADSMGVLDFKVNGLAQWKAVE